MDRYEEMLTVADGYGLQVRCLPLTAYKGRIKGNHIGISNRLNRSQKACVLAEEIGHYETGFGDILDDDSVPAIHQENHARQAAYFRLASPEQIVQAIIHHRAEIPEMAEYLGVTERFLLDAINYYRNKYGLSVKAGAYLLIFYPYMHIKGE